MPDRGHVYFNGVDATELSVQQRRVGFVFQNYALFKHMDVAENIGDVPLDVEKPKSALLA